MRLNASSVREDADRLREDDEDETAALARCRVDALRRRVEVVARTELVRADLEVAFEHVQLFARGVIVGGDTRAGVELQEVARLTRGLVVPQRLHRDAGRLARAPLRGGAAYEGHRYSLGHRATPTA